MESALAFPSAEFERRLADITAGMVARGLDALIVTRPENIFYASGYRAAHIANRTSELHALVIRQGGPPRLICRAIEAETVKTQWTGSPQLFRDHEDPYDLLVGVLSELSVAAPVIGIEEGSLRVRQLRRIEQRLRSATLADASGLIESIAATPSPAESACIERAAHITNLGLQVGMAAIGEGAYPYQIIGKVHAAMYDAGQSDFDRSLVAVWSGPRGGRMHDTLATGAIARNDFVTVEIMGVDNHYRAGAQACAFVGDELPAEVSDAYEMVVAMHDAARAAVRAGVAAGAVFDAASVPYRQATGSDYYRRVGGSMGLTQFAVDLVKGRPDVLTPGIPLLIQTLVDDPVLLTCASTVVVTDDGYRELTHPIRGLAA